MHAWLVRYACGGWAGLAEHSSRPLSCPHQITPELEARIMEMRREHPGWGPRTILYWLECEGFDQVPGHTSIERCLRPGPALSAASSWPRSNRDRSTRPSLTASSIRSR